MPVRSSSCSASWMRSASLITRWARCGCGWATWSRPPRRSIGPMNTDTTPNPDWPSSSWPRAMQTRRPGRSLAALRLWRGGDGTLPLPGGPDSCPRRWRSRWRGETSRPPGARSRSSKTIASEFEPAGVRGGRSHGSGRGAPPPGGAGRGRADPRAGVATVAGDRAALRERPDPGALREGAVGGRETRPLLAGTCGQPAAVFERLGASLDLRAGGGAPRRRRRTCRSARPPAW